MKKALPAAIALASSLGFATAANAVEVNHDRTGEVLLYPYYTVEDGNDTLVNIVNTSARAKAVKVRFVEAMNSQEVLDFNLYMSAGDVWTASISRSANGAKLVTHDTSCTVPAIPEAGVEFRNFQYTNTSPVATAYSRSQGGPQGTDRTRTGYLEVIEMGVLYDDGSTTFTPAYDATHISGVPADCGALVDAWKARGAWLANPTTGVSAPTGGLYGSAIIVDVTGGTDITFDATALMDFASDPLHFAPGNLSPSLSQADEMFRLTGGVSGTTVRGVDAVSAVLQKASIANDYLTDPGLNATTDWVVTFPTKRYYVNGWSPMLVNNVYMPNPALSANPEPFTAYWTTIPFNNVPGTACEPFQPFAWDREEGLQADLDFSPPPVQGPASQLCYEANVVHINNPEAVDAPLGTGYTDVDIDTGYQDGWIYFDLTNGGDAIASTGVPRERKLQVTINGSTSYLWGLPTIGFAAHQFTNGDVDGLLSNYAGSSDHKANVSPFID